MKKVFFADPMTSTPLQEGGRQRDQFPADVKVVESARDADVIVARNHYKLNDYFNLDREYYVWTHEPAWCPVAEQQFVDAATGRTIHASTPQNGDVYLSPLFYFPFYELDIDEILDLARQKSKPCAIMATFRTKYDRYLGAVNVDLSEHRQRLAIGLQRNYDFCDIFGQRWPKRVKVEGESRGEGWRATKQDILRDYSFNLAFESTKIHNYVTEKIWDPYVAGTIPLYHGRGSGVDAVLSDSSYIDCSDVKSAEELFDKLCSVSLHDRLEILRSALADIEKIRSSTTRQAIWNATADRFVERIRGI